MKDKDQYNRELSARIGLADNCAIPILQSFDGDADESFVEAVRKQESLSCQYRYLHVLPLSDKSLHDMITHDNICGNMDRIRFIVFDICDCLRTFHASGRIHGDIKPLNIMRKPDGHMILIDLDASVSIPESCGVKLSTVYVPPEMLDQDAATGVVTIRRYDVNPLSASISYDMWALGALLYNLCTGQTLWQSSVEDNIVNDRDLLDLFEWSAETKQSKLSKMTNPLARNLISQLLSKDRDHRPDVAHVLSHPFITGHLAPCRLPGQRANFDVFISYRYEADADIANSLEDKLTSAGV